MMKGTRDSATDERVVTLEVTGAPDELTPRQIVAELDKYIVGQDAAKRAVAIALRNRGSRSRRSRWRTW